LLAKGSRQSDRQAFVSSICSQFEPTFAGRIVQEHLDRLPMSRQGSNSVQVRHYNERVVLDTVRRLGEASKAEIARLAHLTPQAVAGIVDGLMRGGYVEMRSRRLGYVGSPSQMYGLAAEGAFSVGIHVGRRSLDCLLIDLLGRTRMAFSHEYDFPDPDNVVELAKQDLAKLRRQIPIGAENRVAGVGIAMPYFLGGWNDDLGFSKNIVDAWAAIDLQDELARIAGVPIHLENDASAAAIAELVYGLGRTETDFLYLSLNTFVGGGLVIDGKLQTGPNGNTAALGPFPVGPSKLSSVARPKGSFEILLRRASVFVLMNHLRVNGVKINRAREIETLGKDAARLVQEWREDAVDALVQAIIGAVSVVDLNAVVVDGILPIGSIERTLDLLRTRFGQVAPEGIIHPRILLGSMGANAAAIGAAILPFHAMFAPDSDVLVKKQKSDRRGLLIGIPGRLTGGADGQLVR
jgi:predicted NBD/HSP70 family sugar kinase